MWRWTGAGREAIYGFRLLAKQDCNYSYFQIVVQVSPPLKAVTGRVNALSRHIQKLILTPESVINIHYKSEEDILGPAIPASLVFHLQDRYSQHFAVKRIY